jgi:hydrophobe/amphiphile efflux-1 (HAE1) family protein
MKQYPALTRPLIAIAIPLVILVAGVICLLKLPIAQYPDLVPPSVAVTAVFPGASPQVMTDLVAAPLESALSSIPDVWYMISTSSASGVMTLRLTFRLGLEPEVAENRVNQKAQAALASLPEEVRRNGLSVTAGNGSFFQIVTLSSPDGRYDSLFLNDYAQLNILNKLRKIKGLASAELLIPEEKALRIWFDPGKLAVTGLTAGDLVASIREFNSQFAAGSFGLEPAPDGQGMTWLTSTTGRLTTPGDFENIIVRVGDKGEIVRLGDVAEVTNGAADYSVKARLNGAPVSGISLSLAPGANALDTANEVRETMEQAQADFPEGMEWDIPYDVTVFVRLSIEEVIHTLLEALVLVVLVIFLFLHNFKATLIPALAVPVAIVGTMIGLKLLGFSINLLTLFALVLSIGIVVDDAIVVLENAERLYREGGRTPWEATNQAMHEVASPVIAIVLVLAAVFIPVSFVGGLTGEMFKQFGLTITLSVAISGLVALTLTPVMCASLIGGHESRGVLKLLGDFIERILGLVTIVYLKLVSLFVRSAALTVLVLLIALASLGYLMKTLPQGLVPQEDQGFVIAMAKLPDGASMPRTDKVLSQLSDNLTQNPHVNKVLAIAGLDLLGGTGSKGDTGVAFVMLKPWDERPGPEASAEAMTGEIFGHNFTGPEGLVVAFSPPPIVGLGTVGGLEGYLTAPAGTSPEEIVAKGQLLTQAAKENPVLASLSISLSLSTPTIKLDLDVDKSRLMGVWPADVYQTLAAGLSGIYVNDFALDGHTYKVIIQSGSQYRLNPGSIDQYYVKSRLGAMVPLANLIKEDISSGPFSLDRFDGQPAARFSAQAKPGFSNLSAMSAIEETAVKALPQGWSVAWSGGSYQEKVGGGINYMALVLAMALVYLILTLQYENLRLPLVALMGTPFALLGACLVVWGMGFQNDLYVQVAMVTLIGLSVKNSILMAEFAFQELKNGTPIAEAAMQAASKRFRPILMTSMAFILGCLPLSMSSGAGSASRHVLGGSLIGGMLFGTLVAPVILPGFISMLMKGSVSKSKKNNSPPALVQN